MPAIGVLFDIDELGGGLYGYEAYKVFFDTLNTRQVPGSCLSDGDTNATLTGSTRQYCIAMDASDESKINTVRTAFSNSTAKGLLPLKDRFLDDAGVRSQPLVDSAQIGPSGELVNCTTSWVLEAWKESQVKFGTVTLWTEAKFNALRKTVTKNELYKELAGIGLILFGGLLAVVNSGEGNLAGCLGLFAYILMFVGMWLFLFRWLRPHTPTFDEAVLLAQKQNDWFRTINCKSCGEPNKVNIGYVEYPCQKCGTSRRTRATIDGANLPDIMVKGHECADCKEVNMLSSMAAIFTCEKCGKDVKLERVPV